MSEYDDRQTNGEHPTAAPQIVPDVPEPKCPLDNGARPEVEGVPTDAQTARLHAQAAAAQKAEEAYMRSGPASPAAAQEIIEALEAQRDRQARAIGDLMQGVIMGMSCLSAAMGSLGAIEAHDSHITDRLDSLFYQAGQLTENIARLRGIDYQAPISFFLLAMAAEEGEGVVEAKVRLRKPLGAL